MTGLRIATSKQISSHPFLSPANRFRIGRFWMPRRQTQRLRCCDKPRLKLALRQHHPEWNIATNSPRLGQHFWAERCRTVVIRIEQYQHSSANTCFQCRQLNVSVEFGLPMQELLAFDPDWRRKIYWRRHNPSCRQSAEKDRQGHHLGMSFDNGSDADGHA